MANISLTRVNQKLAQISALFNGVDASTLTPIHHNSLKEAAAFHMVCAYQHYLREIAETYGLKNASQIGSEADLVAAFHSAKKHPVEAKELMQLKDTENSWLKQLNSYYMSLWSVPMVGVAALGTQAGDNIIEAVHIASNHGQVAVDIPLLLSWHYQFVALITRHRQTSAEF